LEQKTLEKRKIDYIAVPNLRFDPRNPRLPPEAINYSQNQIFDILERDFDLLPIAKSMADNGYFDEEPLIVIPKEKEKGVYTVVEGNRRLAALKLLTDPNTRARSPNRHTYEKLTKSLAEPLDVVPVVKRKDREEIVPILGFRHIAGIMKWESLSKARYIHDLVEKRGEFDFDRVGRELGVGGPNVKKNYLSYRIYLQARDHDIETKGVEEDFSVFYTALSNLDTQRFIGYSAKYKNHPKLRAPVPKSKLDELAELVGYIYGTSSVQKVIAESRQLRDLGKVLASPSALNYLRSGGSLKDAYSLTEGEEKALMKSLNRASFNLEESLRYLYKHKDDPEIVKAVQTCVFALLEVLKNFPEVKDSLVKSLAKG
jgi:hypothetical protein